MKGLKIIAMLAALAIPAIAATKLEVPASGSEAEETQSRRGRGQGAKERGISDAVLAVRHADHGRERTGCASRFARVFAQACRPCSCAGVSRASGNGDLPHPAPGAYRRVSQVTKRRATCCASATYSQA